MVGVIYRLSSANEALRQRILRRLVGGCGQPPLTYRVV
jgi:hypothetical protein